MFSPLHDLLVILLLDALIGDPRWLYRRLSHPVVWMGKLLAFLEQRMNRPDCHSSRKNRIQGIICLAVYLLILTVGTFLLHKGMYTFLPEVVAEVLLLVLASTLLAARSLYEHVKKVATSLDHEDIPAARQAVARIVGRDVSAMDSSGLIKAALESLAENFSDAVIAPCFWYLIGGVPGLVAYKAINTADSMVGHRTPRYRHFGMAAARLDDLVNLIPARLSALLIVLAGGLLGRINMIEAVRLVRCQAPAHVSPNAGWPEAALAYVLSLQLGGSRQYGGYRIDGAYFGKGRHEALPKDIETGLRIIGISWIMLVLALLIGGAI